MFPRLRRRASAKGEGRTAPSIPTPHQIVQALLSERPSPGFAQWAKEGSLAEVLPDLDALRQVRQLPAHRDNAFIHTMKVVDAIEPLLVRRLAALLHDIAKALTYIETPDGRTRFFEHDRIGAEMVPEILAPLEQDPDVVEAVQRLVGLHMRPLSYSVDWTDAAVRRLADEAEEGRGRAGWDDLLALARADLRGYLPEPIDRGLWTLESLEARRRHIDESDHAEALDREAQPRSPLDGSALLALVGREPGPWVGRLKGFLEDEVRAGRLLPGDEAGAAEAARRRLAEGETRTTQIVHPD